MAREVANEVIVGEIHLYQPGVGGHEVVVETNAGEGIGMTDADYEKAGATVVDTTGAGDAFIAGYIMSLVAQNLPFDHCISFDRGDSSSNSNANGDTSDDALCNLTMFRLRFASWVAGRKLGGPGAQGALPSAKDVDEYLGVTYPSVQEKLAVLVG